MSIHPTTPPTPAPSPGDRTPAEEIAGIEVALDILLRTAIGPNHGQRPHEYPPAKKDRDTFEVWTVANIFAHMDKSQAARSADSLIRNPIGWALRMAVKVLGERLFELGGVELMQDVCQRVADMDESNWSRRTDIMDKRWDGVGTSAGVVGWLA